MAKKIRIIADVDRNQFNQELSNAINSIKANKIKINFDNNSISQITSQINNVYKNINNRGNSINGFKDAEKSAETFIKILDNIDNKIKSLETKKMSNIRLLGNTDEVNQLNKQIDEYISKLNSMKSSSSNAQVNSYWKNINSDIRQSVETIKSGESAFSRFAQSLSKFGIYLDIGSVVRSVFNEFKQGLRVVMDVENSFVDLRRIVDITDQQAKQLQQTFGEMAINLATTTSKMTDSITTYAKLGYNLQDSQNLAQETQKFNLAGDINDLDEATTDVISTLKGFKLEAKDVTSVVDRMNTASNKYAVSAQDIATIMQRSSASLKVAGNDLSQSIALGTTANEIVQDASRVGTALDFRGLVA